MKLKKSPNKKLITIIAVALVAAAVIIGGIIFGTVEHGKQIESIKVDTLPTKLSYYVGEKFDPSGMVVRVTLNNGESYTVDLDKCTFTGFDSSKKSDRVTVVISYEGHTTNLYVPIKELPTLKPTLASIEVSTLPKTEYKVGEWLNTKGGIITLHYSDGSKLYVNLTNRDVYGFNSSAANDSLILTVKYTDNGVTCSTTYTVKVVD